MSKRRMKKMHRAKAVSIGDQVEADHQFDALLAEQLRDDSVSGIPEDLEQRVAHLVVCGQREMALRELCDYMRPYVGELLPQM